MVKDEIWQELATRSGIAADKLKEVITSEAEETIELSNVTILNDEELEAFKETIGKASAKAGAKTMMEMEIKAQRDKYGLEFEGKTIENLLQSFAEKQVAAAKIEPNKKVSEALESVKNIQKTYETDMAARDKIIAEKDRILNDFKTNGELRNHIPEGLIGIDRNDFLTIAKTKAEFGYDDEGNFVVMENGKVKRDKVEKPISPKTWLTDLAIEKKWTSSNGRGGNNQNGDPDTGFKTMNDLFKHMDKNKINPQGPEGEKLIAEFNNKK